MKILKRLIAWVALSLLLQISGLYILDNFVFKHSSEFKTKKIELKKDNTKNINAVIPTNAENIDLSYDGKYLTYYKGTNLCIEDAKTSKINEVKTKNDGVIMYSKWLDNRNILAIVEKVKKNGIDEIELITYNAVNSSETFVKEICKYEKNMKINDITTSVLTGVYYIDVNKGEGKDRVYRIDRNDDLRKVNITTNTLGNMQVIQHQDRLIYEDKVNSKFFATSPDKQLKINSDKRLDLLGIDRNDEIYIGELNGDKVESIIYGKINEDTSTWNTITLDLAVDKNDLYFSNKSQILINDEEKDSVKNLTTGSETKYEGKFIEIKEDFIATVNNDGKLIYKKL